MPRTKCSWVLSLLALSGCAPAGNADGDGGSDADADGDVDSDSDGDTDTGPALPGCDRIDLLLVLDSRGSTEALRAAVGNAVRPLLVDLAGHLSLAGPSIDLRVGVTTVGVQRGYSYLQPPVSQNDPQYFSDDGPDGVLLGLGSCGLDGAPWVQIDGDDPAPSANEAHCVVAGIQTSPALLAMPLAAVHQALGTDPDAYPGLPALAAPGQPNEGFYRDQPGTLLAVIAVAATDDCSVAEGGTVVADPLAPASCRDQDSIGLYPPEAVAEFLGSISDGGERLAFAALAPDPDVEGWYDWAPARRLDALTELLGGSAAFHILYASTPVIDEAFEAMAEWFVQRCDALGSP